VAFANTRWSLVLAAGEESKTALSDLITIYWYPLYAFARRRGVESHAAEDLVQGFFAVLIEKGYLRAADRERGRFRTFLLTAFRHYMSKEREKAAAQKRGGDRVHLSLDFESGEERYRLGMTSGAFQVALHRMKRRYRDALRAGIAETVETPADINDEIRRLMEAVAY